ncbi:phosphonoacetaldehyde reductase [Glaciecola sp. KUL10]|uniref:phosphonoacetaldehyde reductase n=1 Tax=Glaciecola sp. (strain KUL10) TaxID=2161813 RepID=UPI000D7820C2|nr:phosphonoacetaldehyde reductase [Glaciecola sp. KUL10]GBL05758.1 iron-containing alcohol dehydrogenase [Glaciecola sp. KUL10]
MIENVKPSFESLATQSQTSIQQSGGYIQDCVNLLQANSETHLVKRVLLITSPSFIERGMVNALESQIIKAFSDISFDVLADIKPNPEMQDLSNALPTIRALFGGEAHSAPQIIIALGGGSVIDSAKVLSAWLTCPSLVFSDLVSAFSALLNSDSGETSKTVLTQKIPLIAIPTTSGTGAEVTPFATVWDSNAQKKHSLVNVPPDFAILDASLCSSLPYHETLYGGLDALSHAIESLWNHNRTANTEVLSYFALDTILEALPTVLADPVDLASRQKMQQAACVAGLAISHTKTAIAHAISYPITLKYAVPHGLACSFTLAEIVKHFGAQRLGLKEQYEQKIADLVKQLALPTYLEKYTQGRCITHDIEFDLDPSRAGNFVVPMTSSEVLSVINKSQGTVL